MPDRVFDAFAVAISGLLTQIYRQSAGDLEGSKATIRWVSERISAHPAFLRLPLLACEATDGDPTSVIPVAAAWHLFHCTAYFLDSAADGALPILESADSGGTNPGLVEAALPRVANDAVSPVFPAHVSLATLCRSQVDPDSDLQATRRVQVHRNGSLATAAGSSHGECARPTSPDSCLAITRHL
ncbi:MAG: hypothetical protein M8467_09720 [Anaerolineae bacterium]|nr:hypothetical protein [Anaerolineae bacterium]